MHHGRVCSKDHAKDRRRKVATEKTKRDLQDLNVFVEKLLAVIRTDGMANVNQLIGIIRCGASQEDIVKVVERFSWARTSAEDQLKDHESQSMQVKVTDEKEPVDQGFLDRGAGFGE